jgi:hypothetical protein
MSDSDKIEADCLASLSFAMYEFLESAWTATPYKWWKNPTNRAVFYAHLDVCKRHHALCSKAGGA